MARGKTAEPAPLFEAVQSFASAWLEQNGLHEFPSAVCQKGTLVREGHPILKAHPDQFIPARSDIGEGKHRGEYIIGRDAA